MEMMELLTELSDSGSTWMKTESKSIRGAVYREDGKDLFVTHRFFRDAEEKIARLCYSKVRHFEVSEEEVQSLIRLYESKNHINLDQKQKKAVKMMVSEKLCILTGGPGTGKTSVLKAAFFVLKKLYPYATTAFTAPTGKAATRITESAGFEASTIQSKIGDKGTDAPLSEVLEDFLFIDEVSMLDTETMQKILCALSYRTRLILIGDVDQLPSVEPGAVLRDLVDSGLIPSVHLTKTFRQDNESEIFANIHIVRNGMQKRLVEGDEFKVYQVNNPLITAQNRYLKNLAEYGRENTILLSPYRDGGTINSYLFNKVLQRQLNQRYGVRVMQERNGKVKEVEFREGDPVIQLRNRDGIVNGDVGTVVKASGGTVRVEYADGVIFSYKGESLNEIDLAYAMSVNKSQGSEYDCVILVLLKEHENMNRNMIYTGITRAKKKVEIITDNYANLQAVCKIQEAWERKTFLREELEVAAKQCELLKQVI